VIEETNMANEVKQFIDFFQEKRGYFFLARLCLKVGRDLTKIEESAPAEPELLGRIEKAAKELGVSEGELNEAIVQGERLF